MIFLGDCVDVMKTIESNSIDCVITSPPYDEIRKYGGKSGFDINELGKEIKRILKDGCFAIIVIADQKKKKRLSLTTARLMVDWVDECGLNLCDWLIYKRQGRIGKYHSFRRDHESILVFFNGDNPRDIDILNLKKPVKFPGIGRKTNISMREGDDSISKKNFVAKSDFMCRGSVWEYNGWGGAMSKRGWHFRHPAMMRDELARDLVIAFSKRGDTILDPFAGSGTTGVSSINCGRKFVGIEINEDYCSLAKQRIVEETSQESLLLDD